MTRSTYSSGWLRCGTWPAPANVPVVTCGRVSAIRSTTRGKKGGLWSPNVSNAGAAKPRKRRRSSPSASGSQTSSSHVGALKTKVSRISKGSFPSSWPERNGLDKRARAFRNLARPEQLHDRSDTLLSGAKRHLSGRHVFEGTKERRLVHNQRAKQFRAFSRQPQDDRTPEGIPDNMRRDTA